MGLWRMYNARALERTLSHYQDRPSLWWLSLAPMQVSAGFVSKGLDLELLVPYAQLSTRNSPTMF